jgi:hypothetical protein
VANFNQDIYFLGILSPNADICLSILEFSQSARGKSLAPRFRQEAVTATSYTKDGDQQLQFGRPSWGGKSNGLNNDRSRKKKRKQKMRATE